MKTPLLTLFTLLVLLLSACGKDTTVIQVDSTKSDPEADLKAACDLMPSLCNKDPKPGFAKFSLGSADAVRWTGTAQCHQLDLRTGRYGDERLTKVEGKVEYICGDDDVLFEFIYRKHTKALTADGWTSAFRPLTANAAYHLLKSCTSSSTPDVSVVVGKWWKANNTYAENLLLNYIAPLALATELLPFDDDGFERVGEEVIDNVETVQFRNEMATVWMYANGGKNRPLRVVDPEGNTDMYFTEWDTPFTADIPEDIHSLTDICETH